jgi:hypothetical protein
MYVWLKQTNGNGAMVTLSNMMGTYWAHSSVCTCNSFASLQLHSLFLDEPASSIL